MTGGGTGPRHGPDQRPHLLLGALSLDIYLGRDLVLPGGGVLNMAWQWRRAGVPFRLLSRVGDDRPDVFRAFLDRHGIPSQAGLVAPGRSASIDIVIQPDLQPYMDNFVEGVWATYRLLPEEEALVAGAAGIHLVLVEGAIRELRRLATDGLTDGLEVSADFLSFRHYTVERMADTMADVDIGFVGWPGEPDDPAVAGIRGIAHDQGKLVVVTFGSRGVRVFDGRPDGGGDAVDPGRGGAGPGHDARLRRRLHRRLPRGLAGIARRGRGGRARQAAGRRGDRVAPSPPRRGLRRDGRDRARGGGRGGRVSGAGLRTRAPASRCRTRHG